MANIVARIDFLLLKVLFHTLYMKCLFYYHEVFYVADNTSPCKYNYSNMFPAMSLNCKHLNWNNVTLARGESMLISPNPARHCSEYLIILSGVFGKK